MAVGHQVPITELQRCIHCNITLQLAEVFTSGFYRKSQPILCRTWEGHMLQSIFWVLCLCDSCILVLDMLHFCQQAIRCTA